MEDIKKEIEVEIDKIAKKGRRAVLKANKKIVLEALKTLEATEVEVSYSGSGDSGAIDGVEVKRGGVALSDLPNIKYISFTSQWSDVESNWVKGCALREVSLTEALDNFTCDWLDANGIDWYNNDGGAGTLEIDVSNENFKLNHTTFYSDSEESTYEL